MAITSVQSIILLLGCEFVAMDISMSPARYRALAQTERNPSYSILVKIENALEHFAAKGPSSPLVVEN